MRHLLAHSQSVLQVNDTGLRPLSAALRRLFVKTSGARTHGGACYRIHRAAI